ncbi:hypothetical protein BASA81_001235 [Batrachochytrium salamandrivorans]|nr:hypothetical protein BASA81_001235 [Batrachochytrium salamandrivorans]
MFSLAVIVMASLVGLVAAQPGAYNSFHPAVFRANIPIPVFNYSEIPSLGIGLDDDYHQVGENLFDACAESKCSAKFYDLKHPYKLPCSTASGFVPDRVQLPMMFPGNYDLCKASFGEMAHFCTIQTGPLVLPIVEHGNLVDFAPFGNLLLGKCVPSACSAAKLKRRFLGGLRRTAVKLALGLNPAQAVMLEQALEQSVVVQCEREGVRENGDESESMGTTVFYYLLVMIGLFTGVGTMYHTCWPSTNAKPQVLFSFKRNVQQLLAPMRSTDLAYLNGVRLLSILWVIYGHACLFGSGMGLGVPVANPSATNQELLSPLMAVIRGGEYAVDTFFFMSGLLAMDALLQHGKDWKLTGRSYAKFVLARYVRLVPVYVFVMHFYVKVMPYWGSGPYWHANTSRQAQEHACKDFWANLLFLNNVVPWGHGINSCMGWTWYLAVDFQLGLLVPLLCALFHWTAGRIEGDSNWRTLALAAPCLLLMAMQIAVTMYMVWHYEIHGAFQLEYSINVYVKPWCRLTPYMMGCLYAMARAERKAGRLVACISTKHALGALSVGLALVGVVVAVTFDDMQCRAKPKSDCGAFYAWWKYGALGGGNWSQQGVMAYFGLSYLAWSLGLVLLSEFAASRTGQNNAVVKLMSHPSLAPLARLTYVVYLIHIVVMIMFYAQRTAPLVTSPGRQAMDAAGFAFVSFAVAAGVHVLVERPINSTLIWALGQEEKKALLTQTQSHRLSQDLQHAESSERTEPLLA